MALPPYLGTSSSRNLQIDVNTVGVRLVERRFKNRALRAENLMPVWEVAEEMQLASNRRRFATQGYGTWAPHAQSTIIRWGEHPLLELTGRLKAALTERGASGQRSIKTPHTFVFGVSGVGPVFYAKFHQGGTKHMPRRPIMVVTRKTREAIAELMAIYIVEGHV